MINYFYYEKFQFFLARRLFVNAVTFEVKWVEGLRGGGCTSTQQLSPIPMAMTITNNNAEIGSLKDYQKEIMTDKSDKD
jgi:hypothetical protein